MCILLFQTGGNFMTDAAKEARRAYKRAWNRANPDKVKQYRDNYWNKRAEQAAGAREGINAAQ